MHGRGVNHIGEHQGGGEQNLGRDHKCSSEQISFKHLQADEQVHTLVLSLLQESSDPSALNLSLSWCIITGMYATYPWSLWSVRRDLKWRNPAATNPGTPATDSRIINLHSIAFTVGFSALYPVMKLKLWYIPYIYKKITYTISITRNAYHCLDHSISNCLGFVTIQCCHCLMQFLFGPNMILLTPSVITCGVVIFFILHFRSLRWVLFGPNLTIEKGSGDCYAQRTPFEYNSWSCG